MVNDTTWNVHTKKYGTIAVDALTADWPTVTRGSEVSVRLWFESTDYNPDLIVADGESVTISSDTTRQRAVVADGGTLTVADGATLTLEAAGFPVLLDYLDYAGVASTGTTLGGEPFYRDHVPNALEQHIESTVLGFEPSDDLDGENIKGFWGVVTGGSDARNSPLTNYQIEFRVFVLAEFDYYADHDAIASKFEV